MVVISVAWTDLWFPLEACSATRTWRRKSNWTMLLLLFGWRTSYSPLNGCWCSHWDRLCTLHWDQGSTHVSLTLVSTTSGTGKDTAWGWNTLSNILATLVYLIVELVCTFFDGSIGFYFPESNNEKSSHTDGPLVLLSKINKMDLISTVTVR